MDKRGNADLDAQLDIGEEAKAAMLFDAYCVAVGGIAYDHNPIPDWVDITAKARRGWVAVYRKAVKMCGNSLPV